MSAAQHLSDKGMDEGDDDTATLRTDLRRLWCNVNQRRAPQVLDAALTQAKTKAQPQQMDVRTGDFSLNPATTPAARSLAGRGVPS